MPTSCPLFCISSGFLCFSSYDTRLGAISVDTLAAPTAHPRCPEVSPAHDSCSVNKSMNECFPPHWAALGSQRSSGALGDPAVCVADTGRPGLHLRPGLDRGAVLLGSRARPGAPGALALSPSKSKQITFLPPGSPAPSHCYHRHHGKDRKGLEKGIIKLIKMPPPPTHLRKPCRRWGLPAL